MRWGCWALQRFKGPEALAAVAPIMALAMANLVVAGLAGSGLLAAMGGVDPGPLSALERVYPVHWALMIYGFTLSLIAAEVLGFLSLEWSGRVAPLPVRAAVFAALLASTLLLASGLETPGLLAASAGLVALAAYSWRTLAAPSWAGLPPTHYNYLLAVTPLLFAAVTLYLALQGPLGLPALDPGLASVTLPVAAIIAVVTRDIPLLLGVNPARLALKTGGRLRLRAVAAYAAAFLGITLVALGHWLAGGAVLALAAAAGLGSTGLVEALSAAGRAVHREVRLHVATHLVIAYAWLAAAGALAAARGLGLEIPLARDAYTHMITLGFLFNVIMGVDAILLFGHAGIPITEAPKPSPIPGALLNAGLLARLAFDAGAAPGWAAALSAALVAAGIALFYVRAARILAPRLIRHLLAAQGRAETGSARPPAPRAVPARS